MSAGHHSHSNPSKIVLFFFKLQGKKLSPESHRIAFEEQIPEDTIDHLEPWLSAEELTLV